MSDFLGVVAIITFFILIGSAVHNDAERVEQSKALTKRCYAQGLVPIKTDAGEACADPRTFK